LDIECYSKYLSVSVRVSNSQLDLAYFNYVVRLHSEIVVLRSSKPGGLGSSGVLRVNKFTFGRETSCEEFGEEKPLVSVWMLLVTVEFSFTPIFGV
jgi:hypothetical protein